MSTVSSVVVQYIVTQTSKNFRSYERLAAREDPLTQFHKTMKKSLRILKLNSTRTTFEHSGKGLNDFTIHCRRFTKFTKDFEEVEELRQDLQGAVNALAQMQKIDETAAKVISEVNQKKEQVEQLSMRMQELRRKTELLINSYEQTLPQKRENGSTTLERQDISRYEPDQAGTPLVCNDDDWEQVVSPTGEGSSDQDLIMSLPQRSPILLNPVVFPSFTIEGLSSSSSSSSFSSSSILSAMRSDSDSSDELHNFDVGKKDVISTSASFSSSSSSIAITPIATVVTITSGSFLSSSSSIPLMSIDTPATPKKEMRALFPLQNSRSCDAFSWLCGSRSKENKNRSKSVSGIDGT